MSQKAPTCVLIKPDGKTLEAFGYDAESKYAHLTMSKIENHKDWYFFQRFKMMLFEKSVIIFATTRENRLNDMCLQQRLGQLNLYQSPLSAIA